MMGDYILMRELFKNFQDSGKCLFISYELLIMSYEL